MNSLKREGDSQRAAQAKQHGIQATDLPGYGNEIPFGNTFVSQNSTGSPLGKLAQVAVLALTAGVAGFGLNNFLTPKADTTAVPPPVNAVLEWEIIPDGDSRSSSREVSERTLGVREESRETIDGGDISIPSGGGG